MKKIILTTLLLLLLPLAHAQGQTSDGDAICGTYLLDSPVSDDVVKIQIYKASNGKYQGRYVWMSKPNNPDGTPRRDINNPDPTKRNRTAEQIVPIWGLTYKDGAWVNGKIYDPTSGKTYDIKCKKAKGSNDLDMRYYLKTPAVGLTRTWKRISD